MLSQPRSRVATDGCVEHPLRGIDDVGHRGCSRVGGISVSSSDDCVHRSNFCFYWSFLGKNAVDLAIAGMSDVA